MSTAVFPPAQSPPEELSESPAYIPQGVKSQRILACILCQQRKVKCDRRFPCANCVKSRTQCVPATLTQRRRKRRFPERDLLDRLSKYEDLMRQNNVTFEPMHKSGAGDQAAYSANSDDESRIERAEALVMSADTTSRQTFPTKNFWHTMSQAFRDPGEDSDSSHDDVREVAVRNALRQSAAMDDDLLFGPSTSNQDLSDLHPTPIQIFKLWQIYLDNVNPLLKLTHTPTQQGSIIEAAGNLTTVPPDLEALMFGIYCITMMTLTTEQCQGMFSTTGEDMTSRFRAGCRQALWKTQFLRTDSRNCLTAFCLYLISIRTTTIPQSLSSMLGIAIRIAQRMGMHSESVLAKCSTLEAEMRRRLWWFLVLFDARVGEMANAKTSSLDPTWDCRLPLNINDSDLHPEMTRPPVAHAQNTEALFIMVRSEIADFIRHSSFHLDLVNPALKHIVKQVRTSTASDLIGLAGLEERIERQYLRLCDADSPIQFMTLWTARGLLARFRLLEGLSRASCSSTPPTESERNKATTYALTMLECDTKVMTSPLTKGFIWLSNIYFPFVAYNHIVQDLKRRPHWSGVQQAWSTMSDNYQSHLELSDPRFQDMGSPVLRIFAEMIHRGWNACMSTSEGAGETLVTPSIIHSTRALLSQDNQVGTDVAMADSGGHTNSDTNDLLLQGLPARDFTTQGTAFDPAVQNQNFLALPDLYSGILTQNYIDSYSLRWDGTSYNGWPGWGV